MLTSDPWIISTGATILWIEVLLENGRALNFFGVNSLRSAGDIYYPVIVGIIVMWDIFALDENIRGLIFVRRWNSFRWADKSFVK